MFKKRSLRQHFLVDQDAISIIVGSANITKDDSVLEIGPGQGALTKGLYDAKPNKLYLLEKDTRLIQELSQRFRLATIVEADATSYDYSELLKTGPKEFIVVSNLPYNVSSVILELLISFRQMFPRMVLMFQKEVAKRLAASINTAEYGRLSLLVQEYYDVKEILGLKPSSFSPPPKVESTVVELLRLSVPRVNIKNRKIYERVLKASFSQRRKMLRRSLKGLVPEDELELISKHIDLSKRPQNLSIDDFALLSDLISNN